MRALASRWPAGVAGFAMRHAPAQPTLHRRDWVTLADAALAAADWVAHAVSLLGSDCASLQAYVRVHAAAVDAVVDIEAGVALRVPPPLCDGLLAGELPACEAACFSVLGLPEVWIRSAGALVDWTARHGRVPGGPAWVMYDSITARSVEVWVPLRTADQENAAAG